MRLPATYSQGAMEIALSEKAARNTANTWLGRQTGPFVDNGGAVINAKAYGCVGDGVTDDGPALQAWIDACSLDGDELGTPVGYLPPGTYRSAQSLQFKKMNVSIAGGGMFQSRIVFDGIGASSFVTVAAMNYVRPSIRDMGFDYTGACTGKGMDFTNVNFHMYKGLIERVYVRAYGNACDFRAVFSSKIDTLWVRSTAGHGIVAFCGPAVSWINCYPIDVSASGKAGYRLAGTISMYSCNGVDSADYWGVFGNDPLSADGFDSDFADSADLVIDADDYPSITMVGCNLEHFTLCGIRVQNQYTSCELIACKIDRASLTSDYHSIIHARKQSLGTGTPIRVSARFFPGSGVPNGGGALTEAWLYTTNAATFEDVNGGCAVAGITKWYDAAATAYYPIMRASVTGDIFNNNAYTFSAIKPRRMTQRVVRFDKLELTPAGAANQAVNVTGYDWVKITASGAYSVDQFVFDATAGDPDEDFGRNGVLYVETGNNTNLTINHNVAAGDGIRLTGGANLNMAAGQVIKLVRSDNYLAGTGGWIQI